MPQVTCPSCRRPCRVRRELLGHSVTCTRCAAVFVAEEPELAILPDSSLHGSTGPRRRTRVVVPALLFALAVLAVWALAKFM